MTKPKNHRPIPNAVPANTCSLRGHTEVRLGRKIIYYSTCKDDLPKGGWARECPRPKVARVFQGASDPKMLVSKGEA
jgi:hypothetical protein